MDVIRESVKVQPYIVDAEVSIDRKAIPAGSDTYDYTTLAGEMLDVRLTLEYKEIRVKARMKYIPELDYPLMSVESVEHINDKSL